VAIILLLTFGVNWGSKPIEHLPISIDVQIASESSVPAAAPSGIPAAAPRSTAVPAAGPGQPQAANGAAAGGGTPAAAPGGILGSGSGYVIPTASGRSVDASASGGVPAASGPAFRETGGKTGVAESLPAVQAQPSVPTVPAASAGKGTGAAGGTEQQRSGQGVLVSGSTGTGSSGNLDLNQLDKAIAGSAGTGKGGSGRGSSSSGTGGTGTGGTGGGTPGSGTQGYNVIWDQPDASKGRELVSAPTPTIPSWVSTQGLTLYVTVAFMVSPEGIISSVTLEQSSGYADVDASVTEAIRRWRFSAVPGATSIRGVIPYLIKAK